MGEMDHGGFDIIAEGADEDGLIQTLLDNAFGSRRRLKAAYRLRETRGPVTGLSFTAHAAGQLVGTIRFWPIVIGGHAQALLLGPLAVAQDFAGHRCGIALMEHGLKAAREIGHKLVVLVGDEAYYGKVGFGKIPPGRIMLPGPVAPERLLVCELEPGAFSGVSGMASAPRETRQSPKG